jgi:hypothetical protein
MQVLIEHYHSTKLQVHRWHNLSQISILSTGMSTIAYSHFQVKTKASNLLRTLEVNYTGQHATKSNLTIALPRAYCLTSAFPTNGRTTYPRAYQTFSSTVYMSHYATTPVKRWRIMVFNIHFSVGSRERYSCKCL